MRPPAAVKAGQVYRARARRGFRYVRIDQVRGLQSPPAYALATEILPSGEEARGWLHGVDRALQARISLTWRDGGVAMPPWYELVPAPAGEEAA